MQLHPWQQTNLIDKVDFLEAELQHEKSKLKIGVKGLGIIFLLWLTVGPLLWAIVVNSLVPTPIRNTLVAATNFTNDAVFGMQCKFRQFR